MIPENELQKFRDLMIQKVEESDPDRNAELALSGGTDSVTVLFAMLASGRKPRCITFTVENCQSEDLQASRGICEHFGLEHEVVTIPWDLQKCLSDVRRLIPHCHKIKKTIVQCMHPWLYIYPAMKSDVMLCGLGGDDHYCMQRKVNVLLNQKGEEAVKAAGWRNVMSKDLNFSVANIIRFGYQFGKTLVDVYDDQRIQDWFQQFPIRSLHKPIEKAPSIYAFKDYYSQGPFRRLHMSYQHYGLKDLHQALMTLGLAPAHRTDPVVLYNLIAKGKV